MLLGLGREQSSDLGVAMVSSVRNADGSITTTRRSQRDGAEQTVAIRRTVSADGATLSQYFVYTRPGVSTVESKRVFTRQ